MQKLLKIYGFKTILQYYEMIVESLINGQITQAKDQFKAMPKKYKIDFLGYGLIDDCYNMDVKNKKMFLELI